MKQNLIQLQETAVQEILAARVQTKASMSYGSTVLNRSRRTVSKIHRIYNEGLIKSGVNPKQFSILWKDVCDMAELEAGAE